MKIGKVVLYKFFVNKIKSIIFLILFLSNPIYGQQGVDEIKKNRKKAILVEVKMNEPVLLKDSLSILLTSFSFKRKPHLSDKGPIKIMVRLSLSKGNSCGEVEIRRHGLVGKSEYTYVTSSWNGYTFKLRDFNLEGAFEIIISKTPFKE
ncbi:hypothetical protein [Aquimarina sediminis]|uniref:hypothetical protein n=1 Tax=Aquimarina sediminis TaxID=2070536 RepID=UPI000CA0558E|nr:hypothetical protein [Aquimarina sediminis]